MLKIELKRKNWLEQGFQEPEYDVRKVAQRQLSTS